MTAYNLVRFRVKAGKEQEFIDLNATMKNLDMKGFRKGALIKTGDRAYAFVGEWNAMSDIVGARTEMVASLDSMRHLLEDLGHGLGVTDPVSGDSVLDLP